MKINKIFLAAVFALLAFGLVQLSSCKSSGSDPAPPTVEETVKTSLTSGQWKIQSTSADGVDQSALFKNMTMSFDASGNLTTVNGGALWQASDQWTLTNGATGFTRKDGIVVQLQEVTTTSLKMSFAWSKSTLGPGRIGSIKGQQLFVMTK